MLEFESFSDIDFLLCSDFESLDKSKDKTLYLSAKFVCCDFIIDESVDCFDKIEEHEPVVKEAVEHLREATLCFIDDYIASYGLDEEAGLNLEIHARVSDGKGVVIERNLRKAFYSQKELSALVLNR